MSRLTNRILASAMAACMGLGAVAVHAQPGPPQGHGRQDMRHDGRHNDRHDGRHDNRRDNDRHDRRDNNRYDRHDGRPGGGPDHRWTRGSRVPYEYRTNHYVVNDWRGHRLSSPPRGYHWIQNGSDYLLVAVATGVIASMVLNSSY